MKKVLNVFFAIVLTIVICVGLDLASIFIFKVPLFAVLEDNNSINKVYKGIFYDTYKCASDDTPVIKSKNSKFVCSEEEIIKEIKDTTIDIDDFACAEALEEFYKDDEYIYYLGCIKSKYIIVTYENGATEDIKTAFKNGNVTINDLERYNIDFIKYEQ